MRRWFGRLAAGLIMAGSVGCAAPAPITATCSDLDAAWGNWPAALDVLASLKEAGESCGVESLDGKLYAAHFNYGISLESEGNLAEAVSEYLAAFNLNPQRDEALKALARLNALPAPTPTECNSDALQNPYLAISDPDQAHLVRLDGMQLMVGSQPFMIRGVNYYPRHAPWNRFLTDANLDEVAQELDLIQQAGFNTLRLFLWYEPLFTCQPEAAVPNEESFVKLDAILNLAAARNLKVLMTLNDLPDLYFRPLYTDWAHYDAQTRYIVRRYRSNTTVLGWDVRNEGDIDYGENRVLERFTKEQVLSWLEHITALVKENDPYHLITAGWLSDSAATAPFVDLVSFHHWSDPQSLSTRIDIYTGHGKPLLLEEVGYSTWTGGEQTQAQNLQAAIQTAESRGLGGWMIWTAFDFQPEPGQSEGIEHHFGLWTLDLTAKPAVQVVKGSN